MGPIAFIVVFLALPIGTALFLGGYVLATVVWHGAGGVPLAVWVLTATTLGALFGLLIGRRLSRGGSPPW